MNEEPVNKAIDFIEASPSIQSNEDGDEVELEGSERAARFVNYWMTITKSTTITSYTTTSTVSALFCTPFDFSYGPCVSSGHGK